MDAIPTTLNGYPVIKSKRHPNGYSTVMVQGPDKLAVATWYPECGTGWTWGHYFHPKSFDVAGHEANRAEADACFDEVAERNATR